MNQNKCIFDEVFIFNEIHTDFVRLLEKIDDKRYCSGGDDGVMVVWDVEELKEIHVIQAHKKPIACLHAIQDTTSCKILLLSSSSDHQIIVWDIDKGVALKTLSGRERMARSLLTLPNGRFLSGGEHLIVWSLSDGFLQECDLQPSEDITLLEVIQNKYVLVAVDNYIMVVELNAECSGFNDSRHLKLKSHREVVTALCKITDSCFISASLDGSIFQWAVDGWQLLHCYNTIENYLGSMRLYPYSVQSVLILQEKFIVAAHGDSLHFYNAVSKRLLLVKKTAHRSKINHICSLYEGNLLLSCSGDSLVSVWRVHSKHVTALDPDDHGTLAENLSNSDVTITLIQSCSLHSSAVLKCLPVGEGKFLSSSTDHRVILWMDGFAEDMKRNEKLRKLMPY